MNHRTYDQWLNKCEALVPNPEVWTMLEGWQWTEAHEAGWTPTNAVTLALVDCLAPMVGEVTYL